MATLTIADLDNGKRDLETVDAVANSQADTTTTRYGQQTLTLAGALRRLGWQAPVPYAPGLNVVSPVMTVERDGVVYRPDPALLPFTTGAWNPDQWQVVQNTHDTNLVYQFPTLSAAQSAAATLPDGVAVLVEGDSQGHIVAGAYVPDGGPPALPMKDYDALRAYRGRETSFYITDRGISGPFYIVQGDTSTLDNGGTWIVLDDGRRAKRDYPAGVVYIDWFGAKNDDSAHVGDILEKLHTACAADPIDKVIQFSGGKYRLDRKIRIRGVAEWRGVLGGAAGTQLMWHGTGDVAVSFDPQDWPGNYQIIVRDLGVTRAPSGSKAAAFEHIRCSEFEFTNVYAGGMACLHRLRGSTLQFFDRNITAECDNVIELEQGSGGLYKNTMLFFQECNFWDTAASILRVGSGESEGVYFLQTFFEKFKQFIGNGDHSGTAPNLFNVHTAHSQFIASGATDCRLILFKSKPGTESSGVSRITFSNIVAALTSSDMAVNYDLNGNTSAGSNLGADTQFNDSHVYGVQTALVTSNSPATTVRTSGQTLVQQGYYTGSLLPSAHGSAKAIQTYRPEFYYPAWTAASSAPSIGNGAISGQFTANSERVNFDVALDFGTSTSAGSGTWHFALPYAGRGSVSGQGHVLVPGVGSYPVIVIGDAASGVLTLVKTSDGTEAPLGIAANATTTIRFSGTYTR